jgi:LAO/AO transport system kinase
MEVNYAEKVLGGSIRALSRLISYLEDEDEEAYAVLEMLYPFTGTSYIIGITGSHGTGKSTLTGRLTHVIRREGLTVGIVAVDPSSPFTGGALLGDRIRMGELSTDPGVFIRSMATRGSLGGLARATRDVVKVLDAFGKDVIIVETVGVGQDEVDIVSIADSVCLLLVPGLGDAIQMMKAGLMEIADIFVVNKADRPGADQLNAEIRMRIKQGEQFKPTEWGLPIVETIAVDGKGIEDLWQTIKQHRNFLEKSGKLIERRQEQIGQETLRVIHEQLFRVIRQRLQDSGHLDCIGQEVMKGKHNPYSTAREIIKSWLPACPI